MFSTRSWLARLCLMSCATVVAGSFAGAEASAAIVVDGVISPGEYDGASHFQHTHSGITTDRYFAMDNDFVYLAFVADTTTLPQPFVNAYIYSGGSNALKSGGGFGVYGDDNDFIIEGLNLRKSRGGPTVWSEQYIDGTDTDPTARVQVEFIDPVTSELVGSFVKDGNVYEARISRDLLNADDYQTLRFGGQLWSYDFIYDNAPVPEPGTMTLWAIASVLGGGALLRRRKSAQPKAEVA